MSFEGFSKTTYIQSSEPVLPLRPQVEGKENGDLSTATTRPFSGAEMSDDSLSGFVDLSDNTYNQPIKKIEVVNQALPTENSESNSQQSELKKFVDNPVLASEVSSKGVYMQKIFPWLSKALFEAGYGDVDKLLKDSVDQINFAADPELSAGTINNLINGFYKSAPGRLAAGPLTTPETNINPQSGSESSELHSTEELPEPPPVVPLVLTLEQRTDHDATSPEELLTENTDNFSDMNAFQSFSPEPTIDAFEVVKICDALLKKINESVGSIDAIIANQNNKKTPTLFSELVQEKKQLLNLHLLTQRRLKEQDSVVKSNEVLRMQIAVNNTIVRVKDLIMSVNREAPTTSVTA